MVYVRYEHVSSIECKSTTYQYYYISKSIHDMLNQVYQ